ncbi:AraC family transcriptional regulator [Paenibacillus aurantius]|uniref:AraC family transcriptional regulator n=1 Tax=Paenibacillus aurantius TaxID=2918900 RepID=A0AA96LBI6_9BACL|nr:AraC family transcriptional regulator [Paenibacillus aurantius]WNQ08882.1 AraC family transcriptional regulator [Paenibacillus aurantius]
MTRYSNDAFLESPEFPFHAAPYRLEPGQLLEPHSHEFIEFVYIAEGSGIHTHRNNRYPIREGDVFIIEPDAEHSYLVHSPTGMTVYNILFHHTFLSHELESLSKVTPFVNFFFVEPFLRPSVQFQSHLTLDPAQRLDLLQLLTHLVKEYNDKRIGYRILVKTRLIEILIYLSRCYDLLQHRPMAAMASEHKMMERVCEFIELHHARPLSLAQVSQMCGMSTSSFTSKFKQAIGKTFIEYRNEVRIRVAKELLLHSDDNLLSIAHEVGFDDLSFFNKLFKQLLGVSPGKYRQLHRDH